MEWAATPEKERILIASKNSRTLWICIMEFSGCSINKQYWKDVKRLASFE